MWEILKVHLLWIVETCSFKFLAFSLRILSKYLFDYSKIFNWVIFYEYPLDASQSCTRANMKTLFLVYVYKHGTVVGASTGLSVFISVFLTMLYKWQKLKINVKM